MKRTVLGVVMLVAASAATAGDGPSLCATPAQAALVAPLYAGSPAPPTFMAAARLGLPEAIVASALPESAAVGTPGSGFTAVWTSLQAWDDATVVVLKGGNVFEVRGRIPGGAPSTKSQYFNLEQPGAGLGGHLRPDLVGAIYAVELSGPEGPVRGLSFVDGAGDSLFGVYVPEDRNPRPALVASFEKTREVIRALPRACPPQNPGSAPAPEASPHR